MLTKRAQVAMKVEVTEGTAVALTGAEAFLVMNPKFTPSRKAYDRDNTASSLSPFSAVAGEYSGQIEFDVELKGSGTAATPPEWGKALMGCGFGEDINGSVAYTPTSDPGSYTVGLYMDGKSYIIWGARGDVSLKLKSGSFGVLHFVFTGAGYTIADAALLTTNLAYQTTKPVIFAGAAIMTLDSISANLSNLEIKMNNKVQLRESPNKASGFFSAVIAGRRPTMTFDPEEVLAATYNYFSLLGSGNLAALSIALTGSAGNIVTVTAPKMQYIDIKPGERSGIATLGIDCLLSRNAATGEDELSIVTS